ncbi:MAG: glycosyltransferase 87 family protein, partial [Candidatus Tumulicola sp.]
MNLKHALLLVVAIGCTALPIAGQFYGDRTGGWLMVDFRAYYCAASAVSRHVNPYFAQSLHACESRPSPPYYRAPANVTVPAPYPPYVPALLYPLTLLPFGAAAVVWWAILGASLLIAVYALARVTQQPWVLAWAVLALSLGLTSLSSGNLLPVCVAALLVAARCAQRGYLPAAALAVAVAMVEPQIALPAALAAFIRYPAIRLILVLTFALLGAVSLVSGGLARNIAYLTTVIPAHALAEVSRDNQYSLSTVVAALGVPDGRAVLIGGISYAIVAAIGVYVAVRLARDRFDPAFALLVPPAFALLGGSFVHTVEIAAAVPACLLLLARAPAYRGALLLSLILLAVPWMFATSAVLFLAPFFPVAYLVYVLGRRDRALAIAAALTSLALIAMLSNLALQPAAHAVAHHVVRPPIDPRLAEASWRAFVLGNSTNRPVMWLLRLPT